MKSLILLDYRDSGMAGSEDNKNPAAFINASRSEVLQRLVEIIRKGRPHVVVTMDRNGGYGHLDHIWAIELTTEAFKVAWDSSFRCPNAREPWSPNKLYYFSIPQSLMVRWFKYLQETDPTSDMAKLDPSTMGTPDERITTIVDVSPYVETRMRAIEQHRSQTSLLTGFPQELTLEFLRKDYYERIEPPREGSDIETDLFAGLRAV